MKFAISLPSGPTNVFPLISGATFLATPDINEFSKPPPPPPPTTGAALGTSCFFFSSSFLFSSYLLSSFLFSSYLLSSFLFSSSCTNLFFSASSASLTLLASSSTCLANSSFSLKASIKILKPLNPKNVLNSPAISLKVGLPLSVLVTILWIHETYCSSSLYFSQNLATKDLSFLSSTY
jgi:hypothetical protein